MPIYDYGCEDCRVTWDVTKLMSESDTQEACPRCAAIGTKLPALFQVDKTAAGAWNQQSYNPGLGCWTKSTKDAERIAKSRGLEPIGNEPVENLHKSFEKQREETRANRWADERVKLYE